MIELTIQWPTLLDSYITLSASFRSDLSESKLYPLSGRLQTESFDGISSCSFKLFALIACLSGSPALISIILRRGARARERLALRIVFIIIIMCMLAAQLHLTCLYPVQGHQ